MVKAYSPYFSLFSALVWAFSQQELKIPKSAQSSDAPNLMPISNNPTTPATAAAKGNDLLDV